uniref:RNA polymerase sigma factor n=1 Tax=Prevotella sp. TaxID=59823 RepID=UPI004026078D
MAKTIHMRTPQQEKEARLVAGMYDKDRKIQSELYAYCSDYFWANCQGMFFADDDTAMEIFQNTFVTFWEKIEQRKIYVSEGRVMGKDDEPLRSSILTYFIGIAKNKYKEWVRKNPSNVDIETSKQQYADMLYDSEENKMLDIIADIISRMSERCSQILTKFYVEGKNLDTILMEIPTIESKNSLKTKKYKCTELLRELARDIYKRYLNS